MLNKVKYAFTLAEVLITLVIIGVIAAITVPAMIQQTQKQEYVSGLKKAYSTLQNALYKMADNNGYPHGDYTFLKKVNFIDEFVKVTNSIKKCSSTQECFDNGNNNYQVVYKDLSGKNTTFYAGQAVILYDGQMYSYKENVGNYIYGISNEDKANFLGRILVDLNGKKKPNKIGYDTFIFYIVDGKGVIPSGINGATTGSGACSKSVSIDAGYMCTAKVLKENKIDY